MTKLTTQQQTILSFHNYMNCDCQLTEDMFLVAWDTFNDTKCKDVIKFIPCTFSFNNPKVIDFDDLKKN